MWREFHANGWTEIRYDLVRAEGGIKQEIISLTRLYDVETVFNLLRKLISFTQSDAEYCYVGNWNALKNLRELNLFCIR